MLTGRIYLQPIAMYAAQERTSIDLGRYCENRNNRGISRHLAPGMKWYPMA
jgi:hypothetical protein